MYFWGALRDETIASQSVPEKPRYRRPARVEEKLHIYVAVVAAMGAKIQKTT
jgi:hypothetical protein